MPAHLTYKPIRAPRGHGQLLFEPPWATVGPLLAQNRSDERNANHEIQGISLARLRADARHSLLQDARQYTSAYRDVDATPGENAPILLAGHQPQLFHPGVWFKNFALSALARRFSSQAVNLLIDNDVLRAVSIRVPAGTRAEPQVTSVPFDRVAETIPYEQRDVADADLFASFAERVRATSGNVLSKPLIEDYWPLVLEAQRRSPNLGRSLAEARHRLEGRWGGNTWEVPLSTVCNASSFAWFACHLLAHLPHFHEVHNASLLEYRRVNRVRSRSHPVPDLERDGAWYEAPFWLWSDSAPARKRAFAQASRDALELTDRGSVRILLPLSARRDAASAVEVLAALGKQGIKLRPRALVTTMYARLVLSDLFLHGIGGAKYDQLTDLIIARFFGVSPPGFVTLSATALLFDDRTSELSQAIRDGHQLLRELRFHPERHVTPRAEFAGCIAEKRAWINRDPPRGQRLARHAEIQRLNAQLGSVLEDRREQTTAQLQLWTTELRRQTHLASREFAFCLFSENNLRPLLLDLSHGTP